MSEPNYESKWWGYIYDQMMTQDLQDLLDDHLRFYRSKRLNETPSKSDWTKHKATGLCTGPKRCRYA